MGFGGLGAASDGLAFGLTPVEAAVGCVVVAVGAVVQGSVGIGLAILAAPVLALIEPRFVPGPLLLCGFVLTLLMTYRERESVDFAGLQWALLGRLAGTIAAAVFLSAVSRDVLDVAFGTLVLLGVALSTGGVHLRPTPPNAMVAGTLSGFMGTISSIGGPPMALIYQAECGVRVRGTLSGFFLIGTAGSMVALWLIGRFGGEEIVATVGLLPGIVAGFALSTKTARLLDRRGIRPLLLLLSAVAGVAVLVRGAG